MTYLFHNITEGKYFVRDFSSDEEAQDFAENYQHDYNNTLKVYEISINRKIEILDTI